MKNTTLCAGYRYPSQIISHAVWLYHRFTLSLCDIEELLAARGIAVSYETVRNWCDKFGQRYFSQIRKSRGQWCAALPLAGRRSGWCIILPIL
jgi:putative transposase